METYAWQVATKQFASVSSSVTPSLGITSGRTREKAMRPDGDEPSPRYDDRTLKMAIRARWDINTSQPKEQLIGVDQTTIDISLPDPPPFKSRRMALVGPPPARQVDLRFNARLNVEQKEVVPQKPQSFLRLALTVWAGAVPPGPEGIVKNESYSYIDPNSQYAANIIVVGPFYDEYYIEFALWYSRSLVLRPVEYIQGWPEGGEDLVVDSGKVKKVSAGEILDYETITVKAGGKLVIGDGPVWTYLGCRGEFRLDGMLEVRQGNFTEQREYSAIGPDGQQLTAYVDLGAGGSGGGLNAWNQAAPGGTQNAGNGGGGAAYRGPGQSATSSNGGGGGAAPLIGSKWWSAEGGPGGPLFGRNGDNGRGLGSAGEPLNPGGGVLGGGGGGGSRGMAGGLLYLRAGRLTGSGIVDLRGSDGGQGGVGGWAYGKPFHNAISPASGGGGGAGGQGGTLVLRVKDHSVMNAIKFQLQGGKGGAGGPAGSTNSDVRGSAGGSATDGKQGSVVTIEG
jgi:hypothetical protein